MPKLVLPEDGARVIGRSDALKKIIDGGDGGNFSHFLK
jgi:hypothetical protein